MTDLTASTLRTLNACARLADELADELLTHGTSQVETGEGNDLLRQRDQALNLAATRLMETGDVYAQCGTCRGWGWIPPGDPDINSSWLCWSCRDQREAGQ